MSIKSARIQLIKDTTANWESMNPILLDGEIGVESKGKGEFAIKIGDGISHWKQLPYATSSPAAIGAQMEELQAQLDEITVASTTADTSGTALEVAQARVNSSGMTFPTLKERLDNGDSVASERIGLVETDISQLVDYQQRNLVESLTVGQWYAGEIGSEYVVKYNEAATGWKAANIIEVEENTHYALSGMPSIDDSQERASCLVANENNIIIGRLTSYHTGNSSGVYLMPEGARYLLISYAPSKTDISAVVKTSTSIIGKAYDLREPVVTAIPTLNTTQEIETARTNTDGMTFPTLKERLDGIEPNGQNLQFQHGKIDYYTGTPYTDSTGTSAVSKLFSYGEIKRILAIDTSYRFTVYGYDEDGTYLGSYNPAAKSFSIDDGAILSSLREFELLADKNYTYRVVVKREVNEAIVSVNDVPVRAFATVKREEKYRDWHKNNTSLNTKTGENVELAGRAVSRWFDIKSVRQIVSLDENFIFCIFAYNNSGIFIGSYEALPNTFSKEGRSTFFTRFDLSKFDAKCSEYKFRLIARKVDGSEFDLDSIPIYFLQQESKETTSMLKGIAGVEDIGIIVPTETSIPATSVEYHALWDKFINDGYMTRITMTTVNGLNVYKYVVNRNKKYIGKSNSINMVTDATNEFYCKPKIGIVSGMHGDERATPMGVYEFFYEMCYGNNIEYKKLLCRCCFEIVPLANPTGWDADTRNNYQGININREGGETPNPVSLESQALKAWIDEGGFDMFLDFHQSTSGSSFQYPDVLWYTAVPSTYDAVRRQPISDKFLQASVETAEAAFKLRRKARKQIYYMWDGTENPTWNRYTADKVKYTVCIETSRTMNYFSGSDEDFNAYSNAISNTFTHKFILKMLELV